MKANEFVKEHGWDYTKGIVIGVQSNFLPKNELYFQLKRLVASHELVEKHSGLEKAKDNEDMANGFGLGHKGLKQAIADVESCQ